MNWKKDLNDPSTYESKESTATSHSGMSSEAVPEETFCNGHHARRIIRTGFIEIVMSQFFFGHGGCRKGGNGRKLRRCD